MRLVRISNPAHTKLHGLKTHMFTLLVHSSEKACYVYYYLLAKSGDF
jgi:hypothetical protein